jgi:hypothetical protein
MSTGTLSSDPPSSDQQRPCPSLNGDDRRGKRQRIKTNVKARPHNLSFRGFDNCLFATGAFKLSVQGNYRRSKKIFRCGTTGSLPRWRRTRPTLLVDFGAIAASRDPKLHRMPALAFFKGKEPWLKGLHELSWQTFFRVCTEEMDDLSQMATD